MTPARRKSKKDRGVAERSAVQYSAQRLLVDTHVWLWWQSNDSRLGPSTKLLLQHAAEIHFSAASVWEISIKLALKKLVLPRNADIAAELENSGIVSLPVHVTHAWEVRTLAMLHRDPFDRMLVAQARCEGLTLVSADQRLAAYDVRVLDAAL